MLFLHALLLFFPLSITTSMAVVLPLWSRNLHTRDLPSPGSMSAGRNVGLDSNDHDNPIPVHQNRHELEGYWRLQTVGDNHLEDFIHFNSQGVLDFVYSRVMLKAKEKGQGEHSFPFYSGVYIRLSKRTFDDEELEKVAGHPAFIEFSEQSFNERLKIKFSERGKVSIRLGYKTHDVEWGSGGYKYEAVANLKPIIRVDG